jgi:hypothetical protein
MIPVGKNFRPFDPTPVLESRTATHVWHSLGLILVCVSVGVSAAENPNDSRGILSSTNSVMIPFETRRGHVMVPTRVNSTNALSLLLDTGYGMTMLHSDHVKDFGLARRGSVTIVGIAGEEPAGVFEGPTFDFSGIAWKPRRVAAFPSEDPTRTRRRDGILGSSFFKRFVVDINSRQKSLTLHSPDTYHYSGPGELLTLTFKSSTPIVRALIDLADGSQVPAQFEIDTGCDGALCIGQHFVESHQLAPATAGPPSRRAGVGGTARTRTGHLARLRLGNLIVEQPAANFFLQGSPVDPPLAGHIGWGLLRDFKVIFDYSRQQLILERSRP